MEYFAFFMNTSAIFLSMQPPCQRTRFHGFFRGRECLHLQPVTFDH